MHKVAFVLLVGQIVTSTYVPRAETVVTADTTAYAETRALVTQTSAGVTMVLQMNGPMSVGKCTL